MPCHAAPGSGPAAARSFRSGHLGAAGRPAWSRGVEVPAQRDGIVLTAVLCRPIVLGLATGQIPEKMRRAGRSWRRAAGRAGSGAGWRSRVACELAEWPGRDGQYPGGRFLEYRGGVIPDTWTGFSKRPANSLLAVGTGEAARPGYARGLISCCPRDIRARVHRRGQGEDAGAAAEPVR